MTEIEIRVYNTVKKHPMASQQELAALLGMSRESVAGYIMRLTKQGLILGKGYIVPQQDTIVVIGGCNIDIHGHCDQTFLEQDSNPGSIMQSPGGVGRNIAENLAKLGENVHLVSIVGQDSYGEWVLEQARLSGVNTQDVIRHPDFPTSSYLALNDEHGHLIAAVADMRSIDALNEKLLETKKNLFQSAQRLLLEANLSKDAITWLSEQHFPGRWMADAVSAAKAPRLIPILDQLSLLKLNQDEARAILGSTETSPDRLAKAILEKGVECVLLSLGHQGALFKSPKHTLHLPAFSPKVVSDTGAGDALLAGWIHAQTKDWTLDAQLKFALACASMTMESDQASHPLLLPDNIHKWIQEQ